MSERAVLLSESDKYFDIVDFHFKEHFMCRDNILGLGFVELRRPKRMFCLKTLCWSKSGEIDARTKFAILLLLILQGAVCARIIYQAALARKGWLEEEEGRVV